MLLVLLLAVQFSAAASPAGLSWPGRAEMQKGAASQPPLQFVATEFLHRIFYS
jgi:hypothetical protein